jgi:hypothetical protein
MTVVSRIRDLSRSVCVGSDNLVNASNLAVGVKILNSFIFSVDSSHFIYCNSITSVYLFTIFLNKINQ